MDNLWNFLESNQLLIEREPPISYIKLFFRGRPTDNFDTKDSKEFFHIPFSKRELISHQRFSVSGQPMLYLGSSLPTVLKELDKPLEDLSFAGFLPFWSLFDNHKIFSLKNSMNVVLENVLPGVFESGSKIDYDNNHMTFSKDYFVENMQNTILMQLCTFPTEKAKATFVEEYMLPQMLTSALLEKGYTGIIFPSTRDFSDIQNNHRFSEHHLNLGIYIKYDSSNDIDESLYDSFFKFTLNGNEKYCFSIDDVLKGIDLLSAKNRTSKNKMNDLIMPVVKLKLHLEYLNNSTINGEKYFDSKVGKIELEFYMKMLDVLNNVTDKINSQTIQSSALA
jgi:hypothetical protein